VMLVSILHSAPVAGVVRCKPDEIGLVRIQLNRPGPWMVRAQHAAPCVQCDDVSTERFVHTMVLISGTE